MPDIAAKPEPKAHRIALERIEDEGESRLRATLRSQKAALGEELQWDNRTGEAIDIQFKGGRSPADKSRIAVPANGTNRCRIQRAVAQGSYPYEAWIAGAQVEFEGCIDPDIIIR